MRLRLIFVCALFLSAQVGSASAQAMREYQELRAQIFETYDGLIENTDTLRKPSDIAQRVAPILTAGDLPETPTEMSRQSDAPAQIELVDLRIALVQLAFAAGGNDHLTIVRAQSNPAPKVIAIQHGEADFADVRDWVAAQSDAAMLMTNDVLHVPLVVFQDGRLDLSSDDKLHLSTSDGVFLANLGVLVIDGAVVAATPAPNANVPEYAPFVATAGVGQAQIVNAVFDGLGFGDTSLFSGVSIINRGLYAPIGQSFLMNSVLRETLGTTFSGTAAPIVDANVFVGADAGGLILRGTTDAMVTSNVFLGGATDVGVRLMQGALNTIVAGNYVFKTAGPGIFVTEGSHDTTISENLVWGSGSGILVAQSDCVGVIANLTLDNKRKGIELRTSRRSRISANRLLGNHGAGLFIGAQPLGTSTVVSDNQFVGNRYGMSSASSGHLVLSGNDFQIQFPRFLEGDLVSQSSVIAANLNGEDTIELQAGGIEMLNIGRLTCPTETKG